MKEKINGFLIENAISIFAVGDTVENIFQLHYGVTKCSSNDLFKQLIEYGSAATLNEFCEGQLMPQIFSQGKTKAILFIKASSVYDSIFLPPIFITPSFIL